MFNKKLKVISVFDPYFHYTMFGCLKRSLTDKARKVFKFEEQEKLHEEIIDRGLAKIYQSFLSIAARLTAEKGVEAETELLEGKAFEKILDFIDEHKPWLTVMGRTGFHSSNEMDIGGNTEAVCRLADSNILIVEAVHEPPAVLQAEESVTWSREAEARMVRIPEMVRGMAIRAVQDYCVREGHTVITESVLYESLKSILPPVALEKMGLSPTGS
jgi:nucleotide-binding universal stress UspA family protein